jgi:hypothetical protein
MLRPYQQEPGDAAVWETYIAIDFRAILKHKRSSRRCGECGDFAVTLKNVAI